MGEADGPGPDFFGEDFIAAARHREAPASERLQEVRRPIPPPPARGASSRTAARARSGTTRLWTGRQWIAFFFVGAVIGLAQLPGGAPAEGGTWHGARPVLLVARDAPTPSAASSSKPLGIPRYHPDAPGRYAFSLVHDDGAPVAYDSCRPIRYVVNPRLQPRGTDSLLTDAIAVMSELTGLQFESEGLTDEAPGARRRPFQPERYGDRWAPVLIAWSDVAELPELAGVAGFGGSAPYSPPRERRDVYVSGIIALNSDSFAEMLTWRGGEAAARRVILHELGHLLGLGHSPDGAQLMAAGSATRHLKDGDLAGLSRLGGGRCFRML